MIPLAELNRVSAEVGIDVATVERDYAISWLLYGVFDQKTLADAFVFKGGTALRKCYFSNYRFSQDLDFTLLYLVSETELNEGLSSACQKAYDDSGIEYQLLSVEKTRDEQGEEAFEAKVAFVGPRKQRGKSYQNIVTSYPFRKSFSQSCEVASNP